MTNLLTDSPRHLSNTIVVFLLIFLLPLEAYSAKGKPHRPTTSNNDDQHTRTDELAATHKPVIKVVRTPEGNVVIDILTPLESSYSHYIKNHSILDENKNTIIQNRFDVKIRKSYSSNYKFKNLPGKYHIESNCNLHGRWIEPLELSD